MTGKMKKKKRKIINIEVDGIDHRDAPDYVDAYIAYAEWEDTGEPLSDAELDALNDDGDFVYTRIMAFLY